jgi:Ca2+-binding RTX toxin-like protein
MRWSIEELEPRRHLSGTLNEGVLSIVGTPGDDEIFVFVSGTADLPTDAQKQYVLVTNHAEETFPFTGVKSIIIRAGLGNDVVDVGLHVAPYAGIYVVPVAVRTTIRGEGGNDQLYAGERRTILRGNAGNDLLSAENSHHGAIFEGGSGSDEIRGSLGSDRIRGGSGNDRIDCRGGYDHVFGNSGNDSITGGEGPDVILGGSGSDTINGMSGDDVIFGGRDADLITGGIGADQFSYVVDRPSEILDFTIGDKPPIDIIE